MLKLLRCSSRLISGSVRIPTISLPIGKKQCQFSRTLMMMEEQQRNYMRPPPRKENPVDKIYSELKVKFLDGSDSKIIEGKRKTIKLTITNPMDATGMENEKIRVDKLLSQTIPMSREYAQFLLSNGHVKINGTPSNSETKFIRVNDLQKEIVFELFLENRPITSNFTPTKEEQGQLAPVNVLYEDNDVIIVNKPYGYAVHSSKSYPENETMIYAIRNHVLLQEKEKEKQKKDKKKSSKKTVTEERLPLVINLAHRLETQMSGILVSGKNSYSIQQLSEQFNSQTNAMKKQFCAVVAIPNINALKRKLNPWFDMREEFEREDDESDDDAADLEALQNQTRSRIDISKISELEVGEPEKLYLSDLLEEDDDEDMDLVSSEEEDETLEYHGGWIDLKRAHELMKEKFEKASKNTTLVIEGDVKTSRHPSNQAKISERAKSIDEHFNAKITKNAKTVVNFVELNEEKRIGFVTITIPSGNVQQIRSHLATSGIPILGDSLYYDQVDSRIPFAISKTFKVEDIMFHFYKMSFQHPTDGRNIIIKAPLLSPMKDFVSKHFSEDIVNKYVNMNSAIIQEDE